MGEAPALVLMAFARDETEKRGVAKLMLMMGISGDFVEEVCRLSWASLRGGLHLGVMAPAAIIHIAERRVERGDEDPAVVELAGLRRDETAEILELVDRLANRESDLDQALADRKWLLLVLTWVHVRRDLFPDPLATAETIYAEFNYPKAMVPFVGYMPAPTSAEPLSAEAAARRMFSAWADFIRDEATRLGCRVPPLQGW